MLSCTKIIILKTIKYGETSLIVSAYTEMYGIQNYLVQGIRKISKSGTKANLYEPGNILQATVYYLPNKNLQRIKEANFETYYLSIKQSVVKNAIITLMAELVYNTLHEPEPNEDLFAFLENTISFCEQHPANILAWLPAFFAVQYTVHLGFALHGTYTAATPYLALKDGLFITEKNTTCADSNISEAISALFQMKMEDILIYKNTAVQNTSVLSTCLNYFYLHIPHLPKMKSLEILQAIFE
jgi:DNA repair protein RecO (recombination protein O)